MLSEETLREIEERANKATSGPWEWSGAGYEDEFTKLDSPKAEILHPDRDGFIIIRTVNADFISHAREDIPALLAHIAELEEQLHRVELFDHRALGGELLAHIAELEEQLHPRRYHDVDAFYLDEKGET